MCFSCGLPHMAMRELPAPLVEQGQGRIFKGPRQSVVQQERVACRERYRWVIARLLDSSADSMSCRLGQCGVSILHNPSARRGHAIREGPPEHGMGGTLGRYRL